MLTSLGLLVTVMLPIFVAKTSFANQSALERSRQTNKDNFTLESKGIVSDDKYSKIWGPEELKNQYTFDPMEMIIFSGSDTLAGRFNSFQLNALSTGLLEDRGDNIWKSIHKNVDNYLDPAKISISDASSLHLVYEKAPLLPDMEKVNKFIDLVGYSAGLSGPPGTFNASRRTFDLMTPHDIEGVIFSRLPLWEKLSLDPNFIAGAARGTKICLTRVEGAMKGEKVIGDVYSDMVEGFKEIYSDQKVAERKALDFLGLYGTRGPFALSPAVTEKVGQTSATALGKLVSITGSALTVLDLKSLEQRGVLYSMPRSVVGAIDYSRSYHFWLSALLTRELLEEGFSPQAAFQAVNRSGLMYELFANVGTTFTRTLEATFDESKKDLVFDAAGAAWSARDHDLNINLEKIYLTPRKTKMDALLRTPSKLKKLWTEFTGKEVVPENRFMLSNSLWKRVENLGDWTKTATPFAVEMEARAQADFSFVERLHIAPVSPIIKKGLDCARDYMTKMFTEK